MSPAGRWPDALSVDAYLEQMWRKTRKRFTRNIGRTTIPDDLRARFDGTALRILVLTEHWCEDSLQLVPVIARLAQEVPDVEVRILREHQHRDLASGYLNTLGHPAIPTFIVLDGDAQELGAIVERPDRITAEMLDETRRFQEAHPDLPGIRRTLGRMPDETRAAVKAHIAAWRDDQHERWARYLLEDLWEIVADPDRGTPAVAPAR